MKKPSWFRWLDAASMLTPAVGTGGLALYGTIVGFQGEAATQGMILCWVVAACFLAIWVVFSWLRKKSLDEFTWYPTYGFMVHGNGYKLPAEGDFDGVVFKTIQLWSQFHPNAEAIVKEAVNWTYFVKDLDENDKNPTHTKVNGFTFANTHTMTVDFDNPDDNLLLTAFEHELGHVIRGYATKNWDMNEHHKFMADHGLK